MCIRPALRNIILTGIAFGVTFAFTGLYAQDRCGTVQYTKGLHKNYQLRQIEFEDWLTRKQSRRHRLPQSRQQAMPYKIPVVIHVIHNGEPIGIGANISEQQIRSQLRVLNEDFNRQNADAINTPAVFASVAGRLDIEFVLARRDPDGVASDGIVRVNGGKSSWSMNDNYLLKSLSYWPAEQYMNIWVCNLTDGHAGYAQFPESDLAGMETSSKNRLTDGVVIWHRAFGSSVDGPFTLDPIFNKGRTTTHETGHFFGLNHTWGDDGSQCTGTDFVSDTPNQGGNTNGCPTHPRTDNCGEVVMFQNYLDYSNDACMNLFTQGQADRMSIVIENSPRRKSLLTSPGLLNPDPLPNDLGIRTIIFPDASVCSNTIAPVIELRNFGSNNVTDARIRFVIDGTIREVKDFTLSLAPQESAQATFSTVVVPSGSHQISFQILLTNGGTDGGSYNDLKTSTVIVPAFASPPFSETFNTMPPGWIIYNPDGQISWQMVTAPNETSANKALKLNLFDYEDKIGEIDVFLSPVLDLSNAPAATLSFDVAHARYQSSNDRLQVIAITNCQDIFGGTILYNKAGDALKTAPPTTSAFTPANKSQWRKELVDLSAFIGMNRVQLAFVGINDWGNNIYLDNISLFTEETHDVALLRLASPSVVTCEDRLAPVLLIQNAGSVTLNELTVEYSLNGLPAQPLTLTDLNISIGGEKEVELQLVNLQDNVNSLQVWLKNPNGTIDSNEGNNNGAFTIVLNDHRDRIPLRENFEDSFTPAWTVVNPSGGMNWQTTGTNFGVSLYFNAYDNKVIGDEAWFVSPVLDFSRTSQASMLFDLSYAPPAGVPPDRLRIMVSKDCGVTFEEISFNFPTTDNSTAAWIPLDETHWHTNTSVNLSSLAGESNARIAFVVTNQGSNNMYIDNIEFFVTADPDPIDINELYAIYGYDLTNPELSELRITFNLPERQDVRFSIINITGQMETDGILRDVLNQTFPLGLSEQLASGVYFIRVQIGNRFYSSKVLVY